MMGIPEGEERKEGTESLFKQIVNKNFPNLWKDLEPQIRETNRTLNYLNANRPSPRHIILKLSKINDKERILKCSQGKEDSDLQRKACKIIIRLFRRDWASQDRVESNIQTIEREKLPTKNNIFNKVIL